MGKIDINEVHMERGEKAFVEANTFFIVVEDIMVDTEGVDFKDVEIQ